MHVPATLRIAPFSSKGIKNKYEERKSEMNTSAETNKQNAESGNIGAIMSHADIERFIMIGLLQKGGVR
jgi:hypothetical protein